MEKRRQSKRGREREREREEKIKKRDLYQKGEWNAKASEREGK